MADSAHIQRLRQGVKNWNEWRQSPYVSAPQLGVDLSGADLRRAILSSVNLSGADLRRANLSSANLSGANLSNANLSNANLSNADLSADLSNANLSNANLSDANLRRAILSSADLSGANLSGAMLGGTVLANLELSSTMGLDSINHLGPSPIGIDTVFASGGRIPEIFLRGCGVPDIFIQYIGSLVNRPIQYYSCFISYSTIDQDFAQRLHNDLQSKGVRCWFAPHDMQAGKKIHEQIDEAIRVYDKLLLILSPSSMKSEWVNTEISKARKRETAQNRKMLFPVRLVQFEALQEWECFDADRGKDSAREIREYYIPDFSRWKTDADEYGREFEKLLRDLKHDAKTVCGSSNS
jgi:TIR domain/Pentapeptide repeats (8 copies)